MKQSARAIRQTKTRVKADHNEEEVLHSSHGVARSIPNRVATAIVHAPLVLS